MNQRILKLKKFEAAWLSGGVHLPHQVEGQDMNKAYLLKKKKEPN